jgi:hypothetical protein
MGAQKKFLSRYAGFLFIFFLIPFTFIESLMTSIIRNHSLQRVNKLRLFNLMADGDLCLRQNFSMRFHQSHFHNPSPLIHKMIFLSKHMVKLTKALFLSNNPYLLKILKYGISSFIGPAMAYWNYLREV